MYLSLTRSGLATLLGQEGRGFFVSSCPRAVCRALQGGPGGTHLWLKKPKTLPDLGTVPVSEAGESMESGESQSLFNSCSITDRLGGLGQAT